MAWNARAKGTKSTWRTKSAHKERREPGSAAHRAPTGAPCRGQGGGDAGRRRGGSGDPGLARRGGGADRVDEQQDDEEIPAEARGRVRVQDAERDEDGDALVARDHSRGGVPGCADLRAVEVRRAVHAPFGGLGLDQVPVAADSSDQGILVPAGPKRGRGEGPRAHGHSGPSWDKLHARRSQIAIMRRGRWRSLASLTRYEKGGMVTKEYAKLGPDLRAHLEACSQGIQAVMLGKRLPLQR